MNLYLIAYWSCIYLDRFVNWLIGWAALLLMPIIGILAWIFPSIKERIGGNVNYAIAFCMGLLETVAVAFYFVYQWGVRQ